MKKKYSLLYPIGVYRYTPIGTFLQPDYCSSGTCYVVVPAKAKHDGGMDGQTMDKMILILVKHDNNNDNTFYPDRYCMTKS